MESTPGSNVFEKEVLAAIDWKTTKQGKKCLGLGGHSFLIV